ncbi:MAG: hypothetical protein ACTHOH_12845 [Lysobacteraceae bacterium]
MIDMYLRSDTETDAAYSLSVAADFMARTEVDSYYWKWTVLGLHSAAQGFLVLALRQDDDRLIQKPGVSKKVLSAHNDEFDYPAQYMDNFMGLYRKAQDPRNFRNGNAALPVDSDFDDKIEKFDQLRHDFVHFNSTSRSDAIHLLIARSSACILLIRNIFNSGAAFWHEESLAAEAEKGLSRIEGLMMTLRR